MAEATPLTDLEQALLRALVVLAAGSEGVTLHEKAEQLLWGRAVASPGAVSAALARLEHQGFVARSDSGPAVNRSRESPRLRITAAGEAALLS
jgi:hypothetical protein